MIVIELRDPAAGVIARSYESTDFALSLRNCIKRKQREANELRPFDRTSAAFLELEVRRLNAALHLAVPAK